MNEDIENVDLDFKNQELVKEAVKGNQLAMYQLYQKYAKAMYNVCYRILNHKEEAEDVLQEAFTTAFSSLNSFRFEAGFGSWIKKIVINKSINHLKKKRPQLQFDSDIEQANIVEDHFTWDVVDLNVNRILKAVRILPEGYRVVFSLFAIEGYDHREISNILNISESTSKSQYLRAKRKLFEHLKAIDYEG